MLTFPSSLGTSNFQPSQPTSFQQSQSSSFTPSSLVPQLNQASAALPAQDGAVKEITDIRAAYTPGHSSFRFSHLFLNVVTDPAHKGKPPGVDEARWRQALAQAGGPNNPDNLWPALAVGFKDLLARSAAQARACEENTNRLTALSDLCARLNRRHEGELRGRAEEVRRRHVDLAGRLLHVTRLVDAMEARLAVGTGYRADISRAKEEELSRRVGSVESALHPMAPSGLRQRVAALAAASQVRAGTTGRTEAGAAGDLAVDEKSLSQLFGVLKDHVEAVARLQAVLRQDELDVQIMSRSAKGDAMSM